MRSFNFIKPVSLAETSRILSEQAGKAKLAAGCTDIIPALRRKAIAPETLVSLKGIQGMSYIVNEEGVVRIGAATTMTEIAESEVITTNFPALAEAAGNVGSRLVQNTATVGGNICNASPAADTAPPLLVYEAKVKIFNQGTEKIIGLADFFVGVGKTVLVPGDVVVEFILPIPDVNSTSMFIKQGRRKALEISLLSVAVNLTFGDNDEITKANIAYGAVAPTPVLAKEAGEKLIGKVINGENDLVNALMALDKYVKPISDVRSSAEYRKHMAVVLTRRAILQLAKTKSGKGA